MDSAEDVFTGEIIDAEQLWLFDVVDKDRYICRGCGAKAVPASYLPTNVVRPYFRATHSDSCDVTGEKKLIQKGKHERVSSARDGFPAPYPSRLTLTEKRVVVESSARPRAPYVRTDDTEPKATSETGLSKKRAAGTIRPICRTFINFPFDRDLDLLIPGIDATTYQQVFRRLKWDSITFYTKKHLFYAPMRWGHPAANDEFIEIALDAGHREDKKLVDPYRVRISWADWSKAKRTYVRNELEVTRKEAIEVFKANPRTKGYLFFIGEQDENDHGLFHVTDHRLICSRVDEITYPSFNHSI
jgi:hypothetical protein